MEDLAKTTNEELREIMRNSIDNQYVPSSIYHKARLELEFRSNQGQEQEKERILNLSPGIYGISINLKTLWKWIRTRLPKRS